MTGIESLISRPGAKYPVNMDLERDGLMVIPGVLEPADCQHWIDLLGPIDGAGRRGLLRHPAVATLARSETLMRFVRPYLPAQPRAVRAIYFDKTASQNWGVAWHQDLAVALKEPVESSGFGPWSAKDGVPHALAPASALEKMLTVRVHLDDCDDSNGALRVVPGSHRQGRLSAAQISALCDEFGDSTCAVSAGTVLLMRPLLLHSSGRSTSARHRRVLHIEYAGFTLPDELQWHEAA